MRIFISMLIMAALIAAPLLSGCTSSETDDTPELIAPDFKLSNLDGQQIALSDFRGQPVLLNFWAIRCAPCRYEMPLFQEIFEDDKWIQEGLVILAVNLQESADDVRLFMAQNGLSFTVLLDTTGEVGNRYGVMGIPATLFIDKDGIIKSAIMGPFQSKVQIEQRLALITQQ
ncbi:MAG: redoxin domain-containing protein [Dehalococcoidales bacterium]|nr:redoxin domain-containing protein [Dehalococcoidales bacterium]